MTRRPRLVLASGSPQRRGILETLGVEFVVRVSGVDELDAGEPSEVALENALRKARAVAAGLAGPGAGLGSEAAGLGAPGVGPGSEATGMGAQGAGVGAQGLGPGAQGAGIPVLGVDTLVAVGSAIYGKPADEGAARATLEALGGRTHVVLSGLALLWPDRAPRTTVVSTTVRFRRLDRATVDWYVGAGEWRGRAGGYAIQGRGVALVAGIEGDYSNVVGLPVAGLLDLWPGLLAH
jgi:septum formation protein